MIISLTGDNENELFIDGVVSFINMKGYAIIYANVKNTICVVIVDVTIAFP